MRYPPAIAGLLMMIAAVPIAGQGVVGHLFDFDTGVVVATADVVMTDAAGDTVGRAISDEDGRFVILVQDLGEFSLSVSRLGYVSEVSAQIHLEDATLQSLEMLIRAEAIGIEGLVVSTEARVASLNRMGFYERKRISIGSFIQPSEIQKIQAFSTTSLLRSVPGIILRNGVVQTRRGGTGMSGNACPLKVIVDGIDRGIDLDDVVNRYHVAAIEVYKSTATVPGRWVMAVQAGYLGLGGEQQETCGAVVVWTQFGRN